MKFSMRLGKGLDQQLETLLANPKVVKREKLAFKIVNNGLNPATAGVKGMQLELPADSQILESSVTDRNPQSIQVDLTTQNLASGGRLLVVSFPPLKTGEFVTVELWARCLTFAIWNSSATATTSHTLSGWERPAWNRFQCPPSAALATGAPINAGPTFPANSGPTLVANPGLTSLESSQLAQAEHSTDSPTVSPIQPVNQSNSRVYFAIAAILAGLALVLGALAAGLFWRNSRRWSGHRPDCPRKEEGCSD
jgi:hypothetical protein